MSREWKGRCVKCGKFFVRVKLLAVESKKT